MFSKLQLSFENIDHSYENSEIDAVVYLPIKFDESLVGRQCYANIENKYFWDDAEHFRWLSADFFRNKLPVKTSKKPQSYRHESL